MNEKTTNTFELLEPTSPEALVPHSWVEPWMYFAAASLVVLAMVALVVFRNKKVKPADPAAIREAAYRDALTALDGIGDIPPREAAVISSLVVRKYLSIAANDPALFETHEEYLSRDKALHNFSEEARASAAAGFSFLAAMKYSAETPDMDVKVLVGDSRALLETLHQGFKA